MSDDQQREAVEAVIYGVLTDDESEGLDLFDLAVKIASALAPVAADEIEGRIWAWLNRYDAPWSSSDAKVRDLASDIAALAPVQPIPDSMRGAIDISDDDEPLRTVRMVPVDDVPPDPLRAGVEALLDLIDRLSGEEPTNQDEMGGCIWCGGTPPGTNYGYATADPKDHKPDCEWIEARALLAETEVPRGE